MPAITVDNDINVDRYPNAAGSVQKLINLTQTAWHATIPGGGAVAVTTAFSDPSSAEADRIPELALAGGGTPGAYIITGTWNSDAQTETITTVAGSTVKGTKPFDTITSIVGPDPGANLDLYQGDSYAEPPARALWTGSAAGNAGVQLVGESAVKLVSNIPANRDWSRRVRRITHSTDATSPTSLTAPYFVW